METVGGRGGVCRQRGERSRQGALSILATAAILRTALTPAPEPGRESGTKKGNQCRALAFKHRLACLLGKGGETDIIDTGVPDPPTASVTAHSPGLSETQPGRYRS